MIRIVSLGVVLLSACSGYNQHCAPDFTSFRTDAGDGGPYRANPETGITDAQCEQACGEIGGTCAMNELDDKQYEIVCRKPIESCGN